ncbi:MAG TPA: tol-pal system protein YbgF [Rhizomicrobium sp.]|nr:tol-pal system protein YbgF [Rhizomicrobium sp.]
MHFFRERFAGAAFTRPMLMAGVLALFAGVTVASAQEAKSQDPLVRQLNAADARSRALQTQVTRDAATTISSYRVADLFGESDEEKAARLQHEQAQDGSIGSLRQRVDDLENSLRRTTGAVEELSHRINELNSRIERMQKDFDYRLCTIAAQQLGATAEAGDQGAIPCDGGSVQSAAPAGAAPPGAPPENRGAIHLAPPSGVLGSVPATASPGSAGVSAGATASGAAGRAKYDEAMRLLAKAQYDEARSAFRAFADAYPTDELAPQAIYWLGDIAYVQKDYAAAARAFAEEIKRYPSSPRAPESMLKLGQSLIAMGQKQQGCTTLGALPSKYPNAPKTVAARAAQERKAASCRS